MAYKWKPGYHARVSAQVAGDVCADLEQNGELSAANLVEVSRPEDAPLHGAFDWNDAIAGENWRKHQARCIIQSIVVVSDADNSTASDPVRAFFCIQTTEPNYESINAIVKQPDKYADLLRTAIKELQAFSKKYKKLKELSAFCESIDQLTLDLNGEADRS